MKNPLIAIFVLLPFSTAIASGVIIVNRSDKLDMVVRYQVCSQNADYSKKICWAPTSVNIPAKKTPADKNYEYMTKPEVTTLPNVSVEVLTAVEKDQFGNIVAKGNFVDEYNAVECAGYLTQQIDYGLTFRTITTIELSDMTQTPYISCKHLYSYDS